MKKIIGISGKQYSGKDTLAKILLSELKNFKRIAIGDAIKIEYAKKHNLTYGEIDSNKGIYRTALIELGNYGRSIDPDYWLKRLIEMDENIIVPDIRLLHEAEIFKENGAFLIRIDASYEAREKRGIITNADDITETELDNYYGFDYIIENNSDYNVLAENSKPLLNLINQKMQI